MDAPPKSPGSARRCPPPKKSGQAALPRRYDGAVLDVAGTAAFLGTSTKCVRAHVARRTLPFRRLGGRIIFVRAELENFMTALPGVSVDEARANVARSVGLPVGQRLLAAGAPVDR